MNETLLNYFETVERHRRKTERSKTSLDDNQNSKNGAEPKSINVFLTWSDGINLDWCY